MNSIRVHQIIGSYSGEIIYGFSLSGSQNRFSEKLCQSGGLH